ncbi:MAG: hypothetical protein E5X83_07590 [Mesorhizobium sp.]|nr:MAG: hypothetical protein EOR82_31625 [Mesorhizobium sp.]TIO27146.1 MAG: hypothetical protein E5X83_07590 [Mesorhizobium sp.]TJV60566.1 MAG: hypothetical protein E5X82_14360 [Mesorhizobium sp.]
MPIGQPEEVGPAPFSVSGPPFLGDLNEAERDDLTHRRGDCVPMNAVALELIECCRQLAIVVAAVASDLDLKPVQHAVT